MNSLDLQTLLNYISHATVHDTIYYKGANRDTLAETYTLVVYMYQQALAREAK